MGDPRRFDLFANFIVDNFPSAKTVYDVAGGMGYLTMELTLRGVDSIVIDPRRTSLHKKDRVICRRKSLDIKRVVSLFPSSSLKSDADLVVGMHPDEATIPIVRYAVENNLPFAIVPCCRKGHEIWLRNHLKRWSTFIEFMKTMAEKADYDVREGRLRMNGKNLVIYGYPSIRSAL